MEKKYYKSKVYISNSKLKKENNSNFFIKANICLGIVICAVTAGVIEGETVEKGCSYVYNIITYNQDKEDILSYIKENDSQVYTFAEGKPKPSLSEEILQEIKTRESVYNQNNRESP